MFLNMGEMRHLLMGNFRSVRYLALDDASLAQRGKKLVESCDHNVDATVGRNICDGRSGGNSASRPCSTSRAVYLCTTLDFPLC